MTLRHVRCAFHPEREAAARCPSCGRDCCRECITEQAGKVYCWPCLAQQVPGAGAAHVGWRTIAGATATLLLGLILQTGVFLLLLAPLANFGAR